MEGYSGKVLHNVVEVLLGLDKYVYEDTWSYNWSRG